MPRTIATTITVELELFRETKNTVRYDIADGVDFPDINSIYINKPALRDYHDANGSFPPSVTVEVTIN